MNVRIHTVFLLFFAFFSQVIFGQWNYVVNGKVTSNNEQVNLEGAVVTLYKNGSQTNQVVTKKNGKYTFVLDPEHEYIIAFTKAGFITKKIFISTKNVPPERSKYGFSNQPIDVDLFEMPPDPVIVSKINELLSEPMGKFVYVPSAQDFDFDPKYAAEVKKKLKELLKIQQDLEKKKSDKAYQDAQFQNYVNAGNTLYNQGKYNDALGQYQNALNINPGDPSLQGKIEETKKKIQAENDRKALFEKYLAVIKAADELFKTGNWTGAKSKYEEALGLVSTEKYPKDQIDLCNKEIEKAKANADAKTKYDAAVKEGDELFAAAKYQDAMNAYTKALGFIPTEKYPKDQIVLCQTKIRELTELDNKYLAALKKGDDAFKMRDWKTARTGYTEALGIKPNEKYPKDQLDLVGKEELKDGVEKQYSEFIIKADALFKSKEWANAKVNYEEAIKLKGTEKYPKDQVLLCQKELDKLKASADLDAKYNAAIKEGDDAFGASGWETAISAYQKALGMKPLEKYPNDQIIKAKAELDKIKNQKDLQARYDAALKEGDEAFKLSKWDAALSGYNKALGFKPGEKYPTGQVEICKAEIEKLKGQKELQAKYDAAIKEGDDAFKLKKWDAALSGYNKALGFKPGEPYPTGQISLCNAELDKLKGLKELQAKYDAAIKAGDDAFKLRKWEVAITSYNEALTYKNGAKYPTDQVLLCNKELDKIRSQKELDEKYASAVKEGDELFKAGNFTDAISAYTKASGFKPMEKYPPSQVLLCKTELDKLKNQKDLQAKYDAAVKEGDVHFQNKKWQDAINSYNKALGMKPGEKYPTDQVKLANAELDKIKTANDIRAKYENAVKKADGLFNTQKYNDAILAYKEALGYLPNEKYPADQILLCNAKLEEITKNNKLETDYQNALKEGDAAFKGAKFENAIAHYEKARGLKPLEKYPPAQIDLCNKEIEKLKNMNDLGAKYDLAIKNGNSNFDAKEYGTAKKFYEEALTYKPGEKLPKDKLADIERLLSLEKRFRDAVDKADKLFAASDWKGAKAAYTAALSIKDDKYPKDQILICDQKLTDAKTAGENAKKYDAAIKEADAFYKKQDWTNALNKYTEATGYKPDEKYPKDRITEITDILARIKAEQDKLKAEKEQNDKYKAAVDAGDIFFAKKDYVNAKLKYEEAKSIFPTQTYPPMMIAKCDQLLLAADPKFKEYNGYIVQGDKALKENRYTDARNYYQAALDVKPEEKYPSNKIKEIDLILKEKQINMEKDMAIKEYLRLVKEADKLFGDRNWNKAKILYNQALSLQPLEQYPKERIYQCDAFLKPGNDPDKPKDNTFQTDAEYEKARKKRFTELTAKYGGPGRYEVPPQSDGYKTITEVVIITETDAYVYRKVEFKFGQIIYYKNDIAINPADYESAVSTQR